MSLFRFIPTGKYSKKNARMGKVKHRNYPKLGELFASFLRKLVLNFSEQETFCGNRDQVEVFFVILAIVVLGPFRPQSPKHEQGFFN